MTVSLYVLIDPRTTMIRYVGYTTYPLSKRLRGHIAAAKSNRKGHRCCWIRSLIKEGVTPEIALMDSFYTVEEAKKAEINAIQELRQEGWNLVNDTNGGEGSHGYKHNEETKKKMSKSAEGRDYSYLRKWNKDPERIRKHNEKIKGKPNPKKYKAVQDQYGTVYPSIKHAAADLGVTPSAISKSLKGYKVSGYLFNYHN